MLLHFVTPDSVESENCRTEVNFAADEQIPILMVYLKRTELLGRRLIVLIFLIKYMLTG